MFFKKRKDNSLKPDIRLMPQKPTPPTGRSLREGQLPELPPRKSNLRETKNNIYDIKYVEDMTMCTKDSNEFLDNMNTPATITVTCEYEYNGFCTCSDVDCAFRVLFEDEEQHYGFDEVGSTFEVIGNIHQGLFNEMLINQVGKEEAEVCDKVMLKILKDFAKGVKE